MEPGAGGEPGLTQRKRGVDKGEETPSAPSTSEVERVVVDGGVIVTYPKGWRVRCFRENSAAAAAAAAAGDGVALANLPKGCELSLRTRRPGDRACPNTRGESVKLKDWMRANDFPLHTRDRTLPVCSGEVLAGAATAAAAAVTPGDGSSSVGDAFVLRVVVDGVTL